MPDKQIIYANVPEYNQETQYVTQGNPVETEDNIYYSCVIHDMPPQVEGFEEII
jgi:hypothetical protein